MLISPGRSNLGGEIKGDFSRAAFTHQEEGRWAAAALFGYCFPQGHPPSHCWRQDRAPRRRFQADVRLEHATGICRVPAMRKAKPVPQTPPATLRNGALGYTKRVTSSFPKKHGVSVWREGDFYRAERVLPSSCQEGLSGPPQGEPGLPLSIANEANGKVFTKKPPWPLPWPRAGSSISALDSP